MYVEAAVIFVLNLYLHLMIKVLSTYSKKLGNEDFACLASFLSPSLK